MSYQDANYHMQALIERLRKTSGPVLTLILFSAVFGLGLSVFSLSGSIIVAALCMALSSVASALAAREVMGRPDDDRIKTVTQEETRPVHRRIADLSDRVVEIEAEMRHMMSERTTPDRLRLDVMTRDIERISTILSDLVLVVDAQGSPAPVNPPLPAQEKPGVIDRPMPAAPQTAAPKSSPQKPANALAALQMENMLREDILGGKMKVHLHDIMNIETQRVAFRQVQCRLEGRLADFHSDRDLIEARISPGVIQLFDRMRFGFAFEFANQFGVQDGALPILCPLMDATFGNPNAADEIVSAIEKHRDLSRHLILALDQMVLSRPTPGEDALLKRLHMTGTPLASILSEDMQIDPDLLFQRGVRFVLADAGLLLGRSRAPLRSAIHPSDLASYLARNEISLIVQGVTNFADIKTLRTTHVIYAGGPVFTQSQQNALGSNVDIRTQKRDQRAVKPAPISGISEMHNKYNLDVAPLRERLRRVRT